MRPARPARHVPLKLSSIESKAKKVWQSSSWVDRVGLGKRIDLVAPLQEIRDCIVNGRVLPDRFYRKLRNSTPDQLLDEDAIMHLHLGDPGTSELLFLVQYPEDVVLLELSNHHHFSYDPPGSVLRALHDAKIQQWQADREQELKEFTETIRASLLSKRGP